jgi:16S rRNA (cytosine967-C5)-methyltransferase
VTARAPQRRRGGRPAPTRSGSPTIARLVAARVLDRVESARAYADLALHAALRDERLSVRDRAFATELVYGTLRWRGRLDFALAACTDRPLAQLEPAVLTLLRLGAYQVLFLDSVPDRAAVDESVRCAQAMGWARASGLINAVLRRLVRSAARSEAQPSGVERASEARSEAQPSGVKRDSPSLAHDPLAHLVHALSIPEWIARRWLAALGPAEAAALARASNETPPLTARANPLKNTREELLAELAARWPDAKLAPHAPLALSLGHGVDPGSDPAFREGRFTVQDEASQLVVELLAPQPGERVLDLCAAPGAKATGIAERVGANGLVVACDRNQRRLDLVGRAARRLELANVELVHADGTQPLALAPFARALVDAPCSGLGTLRRNPDARWRLREGDPRALAETQRALLECAAALLLPGGVLVYSTCTLLPEENEALVASFLAQHPEFSIATRAELPEPVRPFVEADGFMRTWPHRHGSDGFFAARLQRSASSARSGAKPGEAGAVSR